MTIVTQSVKKKNADKKKNSNETVSTKSKIGLKRGGGKTVDGNIIPKYEIIERGEFDMADHTIEGLKRPSSRPKLLIIKVRLRGIKSVKQLELDVTKERLVLTSLELEPKYHLSIKLPYPVISDDGTAKFDKDSHTLKISLPVIRQDIALSCLSTCSHNEEKEATPEKRIQNGNDSVSSSPVIVKHEECNDDLDESPVIVEKTCDHSRWLEREDKGRNLREEFASDEMIPTLCTTKITARSSMGEKESESITNEPKVTIAEEEKNVIDDFQVVDYLDDEDNGICHSNETVLSDESIPCNDVKQTPKQNSLLYCESSLIFELD